MKTIDSVFLLHRKHRDIEGLEEIFYAPPATTPNMCWANAVAWHECSIGNDLQRDPDTDVFDFKKSPSYQKLKAQGWCACRVKIIK